MVVRVTDLPIPADAAFAAQLTTMLLRQVPLHFVRIGHGILAVGGFRQILRGEAGLIDEAALVFLVTTVRWIADTRRDISELPPDHGSH